MNFFHISFLYAVRRNLFEFLGRKMRVPKDFKYGIGDCFFDSMAYLTGMSSVELRLGCMDSFQKHKEQDSLLYKSQKSFLTALFNPKDDGQKNCRPVKSVEEYIKLMKLPAGAGGLWADSLSRVFMEEFLKCKIWLCQVTSGTFIEEINRYPRGKQYHVLYHNGGGVHYEPLVFV